MDGWTDGRVYRPPFLSASAGQVGTCGLRDPRSGGALLLPRSAAADTNPLPATRAGPPRLRTARRREPGRGRGSRRVVGGARRPSRTEGAAGGRLRCHRTTPRGLTRSNPGFVVVGAMRKDASDTTSGPRDRITRSGDSASPRPWAPPSVRTGRGVAHLAVGCHVGGSDGSASSPRRMRRLSAGGSPPTVVGPAYQVRGHVPISGDASSRGRSHRAPGTKPFRVVPQLGTSSPTD
ncbi:hypothetical protein BHE74_00034560 [Ensete ventricosum]|nr:hypothetical protein BHE74_00034560 [Ensete ventricosum]